MTRMSLGLLCLSLALPARAQSVRLDEGQAAPYTGWLVRDAEAVAMRRAFERERARAELCLAELEKQPEPAPRWAWFWVGTGAGALSVIGLVALGMAAR